MSDDHLVCAACSGRVSDGRCPTCRAARSRHSAGSPVPPEAFLLAAALAFALLVVLVLGG
jgi:hypothetical protein